MVSSTSLSEENKQDLKATSMYHRDKLKDAISLVPGLAFVPGAGSCQQPRRIIQLRALEPVALPERTVMVARICCPHLQERKFQGGSGQISECMAKELGDLVKMNSPVYRIDQTGDMVVVETLDKQTYKVSAQGYYSDL